MSTEGQPHVLDTRCRDSRPRWMEAEAKPPRRAKEETMKHFLLWLVMDSGIPLGRFAPWVFGLAIGRMPHKTTRRKK